MIGIRTLFIVFMLLNSFGCRFDKTANTVIYVVRHAEKDVSDPNNPDPELSAEGKERAIALANKLKEIKLDAAFATKYKRTSQTAFHSAKNSNIEIQTYDGHDFLGIAGLIKAKHSGHKVLIVGHSNTVLELLEALGAHRPLAALTDDDYDFFFKLTIDPAGKAELSTQHYGKVNHSSLIN